MKRISIGFDLGIASVGWSILDIDTYEVIDNGVKLFAQANKADERRSFRALRRRYKRANHREERLVLLLNEYNIPLMKKVDSNLLDKRIKGLSERLELQDIINILFQRIKNRGYQPFAQETRENIYKDKFPNMLPCLVQKKILEEVGSYRGLNYPFLVSEFEQEIKEILSTQSKYYSEIDEQFIEKYIKIFRSRRKFWEGPGGAREDQLTKFGRYKNKYDLLMYKENKNYNRFLYENLIKNCSIYVGEKSVDINNYYAEYFNIYNDLTNITIDVDNVTEEKYFTKIESGYKLSSIGIDAIIEELLVSKTVKWDSIFKKTLGFKKDVMRGYRIDSSSKIDLTKFEAIRSFLFHAKEINYEFNIKNNIEKWNKISYLCTVTPFNNLEEMIDLNRESIGLNDSDIKIMLNESFNKKITQQYHSYSEKALMKFIEVMKVNEINSMTASRKFADEIGENVHKSLVENYFDNSKLAMSSKFIDDLVASPVVKKTLRRAIKTLNQIIKEYGDYHIEYISVESNAELLNDKKKKEYIINQEGNEIARKKYSDLGYSENDILKNLLLDESNYKCLYCDKSVTLENMEIEHIIPKSVSADDSFSNKCTSCYECNHNKGDKTPYYFLTSKGDFELFLKRIEKLNLTAQKKANLLNKDDINKYQKKFLNRNLRDTSYCTKEFISQLKLYKEALEVKGHKMNFKVVSMPPKITGKMRKYFKKDRSVDSHHAFDATLCAFYPTTYLGSISVVLNNDISSFWKNSEYTRRLTQNVLNIEIPEVLINQLKNIHESNKCTRFHYEVRTDPNKQLCNANISKVLFKEGKKDLKYTKIEYISDIYELSKLDEINKMLNKNNCDKVLAIKDNDYETFLFIQKIFNEYNGQKFKKQDGKEVSINPFKLYCMHLHDIKDINEFNSSIHGIRPPSKKSKQRPIIKKLRYGRSVTSPYIFKKKSINIKSGNNIMLDSMSQSYTEVYRNLDGGYLFLPVYSMSVDLKTNEPDKNNEFYVQIRNKFLGNANVEYLFRLNTNDYIRGVHKNGNIVEGLYSYFHKTNNRLELKNGKKIGKTFIDIKKIECYGLGIKGMDLTR